MLSSVKAAHRACILPRTDDVVVVVAFAAGGATVISVTDFLRLRLNRGYF